MDMNAMARVCKQVEPRIEPIYSYFEQTRSNETHLSTHAYLDASFLT